MSVSDKLDTESFMLTREEKKAQKFSSGYPVRGLDLFRFLDEINWGSIKGKILCVK